MSNLIQNFSFYYFTIISPPKDLCSNRSLQKLSILCKHLQDKIVLKCKEKIKTSVRTMLSSVIFLLAFGSFATASDGPWEAGPFEPRHKYVGVFRDKCQVIQYMSF